MFSHCLGSVMKCEWVKREIHQLQTQSNGIPEGPRNELAQAGQMYHHMVCQGPGQTPQLHSITWYQDFPHLDPPKKREAQLRNCFQTCGHV